MQATLRADPAQLAFRAILLDQVPGDLQAAVGAQQGLLEVALPVLQNRRPVEKTDLTTIKGAPMTTVDAMLVGAILAWVPSLIVFCYIVRDLRNMPREDLD
ncbi:hypothetical protein [Bradyrhizobium sp. CCBAU 53421]|uniref:hypothetical protein n=1 Tax=Bradyrhizobium sp. CCBAU 53421 TaxID=1325120 RepID=UPI00188C3186|nr:hypothetical protein [Bradyrhizobium sp. CCBAU 53421]QOZ37433.1 hypothetical protein XH92_42655 [Bradyrhizobium sp. CCBAU 53421]